MLGSVIIEVLLVCIFILIDNFNLIAWRSLGSVAIIFGYSIPCLFYARIFDKDNYKNIAIVGVCLACISALIDILALWNIITQSEFLLKTSGVFSVITWALAYISWVLSYTIDNNIFNIFKKISITLTAILSFLLTMSIWTDYFEGFLLRFYYILIVLTIGSFICLLILIKITNSNK